MSDRYGFDPYAVLGVGRAAEPAEIKRCYRDLIVQWHPDLTDHPDANERTIELNEAYAVLSDSLLRAEYDADRDAFAGAWRDGLRERINAWVTRECVRCGKKLYESDDFYTYVATDGTEYRFRRGINRRIDAVYCSNACRQAAYRIRKRNQQQAARTLSGDAEPPPRTLEP